MWKRLALLSAVALALQAADLSGIWVGQTKDRNGDLQDFSFRLSQNGGALTGKMYGDNESTPLTDLKLAGDQISFAVTSELNGQITKFVYTGTVKGEEIDITRDRVGAKVDPAKPNPKQNFKLRRLT